MLANDTQALLLFAGELNISNGPPDTRDFGERGMFGKLVNAQYVRDHYADFEPRRDVILEEVRRLLLGPWENGGNTSFSCKMKRDVRVLDYATGDWNKTKEVLCIRVEHVTEMSNKTRVAYIAWDGGGYGIVKK